MEAEIALIAFAILALVVLGVGATLLWFWSGGRGRKILGTLVLGILLLGVVFAGYLRVAHVSDSRSIDLIDYSVPIEHGTGYTIVKPTTMRMGAESSVAALPTGAWPVEVDPEFRPDVYPSVKSAARGLAAEVAESLPQVVPAGEEVKNVHLFGVADASVLETLATTLRRALPGTAVVRHRPFQHTWPHDKPTDPHVVHLQVDRTAWSHDSGMIGKSLILDQGGELRAKFIGAAGESTKTVQFLDKLWVDDFASFVGRDSKHRWLLAISPSPCTSPSDAERDAIRDAARKLLPEVLAYGRAKMRWAFSRVPDTDAMGPDERQRLEDVIVRELLGSHSVNDRFVQGFQRPYGKVWREAILVRASPSSLQRLAYACEQELEARQRTWFHMATSAVGLLVLICAVYAFLNAATKGYYTWSLRLATVLLLAIGVGVVYHMMM